MTEQNPTIRTVIGIVRDHSASMRAIASAAAKDYNGLVSSFKQNAIEFNQDVIVSVAECGYGSTRNARLVVNGSSITGINTIEPQSYEANGYGTPLYDSVGLLIESFQKLPYANDPNTAFLLLIVTDGEENSSANWSAFNLANKIKELQATDRWTFTFRVPRGYARNLVRSLNLYNGNIEEWETSVRGMEQSSTSTNVAVSSYFTARSTGKTATKSFYADIKNLSKDEVRAQLVDISSQIKIWTVQTEAEGALIREFVEHKLGAPMLKGGAFYKLVAGKKSADKVQDSKLVIIRDKNTGVVYSGQAARDLIGLPRYGDAKVRPGTLGDWEIFIQSTSVNRKLPVNTEVLYWADVGHAFKEGKSAQ